MGEIRQPTAIIKLFTRCRRVITTLSLVLLLPAAAMAMNARVWGGPGIMYGGVTYKIGGRILTPEGIYVTWFPVSELVWPLNVPTANIGGAVFPGPDTEITGEFSKNIQTFAGTMIDSDWTDPANTRLKTVYSESSADLESFTGDIVLRRWLSRRKYYCDRSKGFAVGVGWLYERFGWRARGLDQWYPQNPGIEHDRVSGLAGTYAATVNMPYIEIAVELGRHDTSSLLAGIGYSPLAAVSDADDHILRQIYETADLRGQGMKLSVQGSYVFTSRWFIALMGNITAVAASGMDYNLIYGGPLQGQSWSIERTITSTHYHAALSVGTRF